MLLLSTSSLRGYGLHKIFSFARDAQYDGICLDLNLLDFDTENTAYILALSEEFKMSVMGITAYERRMTQKTVDRIMEMAKMLGSKIVNFYPPHRLDKEGEWFSDYLPKVQKRYKDIEITIINVEPKTFLFLIPEYKDATLPLIKKITGKTALHVSNVDPESGTDLIKTFSLLGNSIHNVYLSDKTGNKEDLLPGRGDMPLESLLIKLAEG
jgi:sugar phosphate isomerase/epimerase